MADTVEPETQEKILDVLPEDGPLSLKIMAQLSANMILSIDNANIDDFIADLRKNMGEYQGT